MPNDAGELAPTNPLDAALQAGSEALVALQLIDTTGTDRTELRDHVGRAIGSLRSALAEVRAARRSALGPLAYGFVGGPREFDDSADGAGPRPDGEGASV